MAARVGRQTKFFWGGELPANEIAGIREKSIAINGEPIDVTSDEDNGWRLLLTVAAQNEVTISISGVTKDRKLIVDFFAGTRTRALTIQYPGGDELSGTFYLASLTEGEPYNDASTFEAELQSSGVVTYTPAA